MPDATTQTTVAPGDLIAKLRATRSDYEKEQRAHTFLLDAYTGDGGFAGKIEGTDGGYWGWASAAYETSASSASALRPTNWSIIEATTYLDRFPREDEQKFQRRRDVAYYTNYIEPIFDLLISYMLKRPIQNENEPEQITQWRADINGRGTTWEELERQVIVPRAGQLGWCPVLFDMPQTPAELADKPITRAQQREAGLDKVRALPLYPANILAWHLDDADHFTWVKIRTDHTEWPDPLGKPIRIERYAIWSRDKVTWWEVECAEGKPESIRAEGETAHGFGQVPLAIYVHKPATDDAVRGTSMIKGAARLNRRHFNQTSELDEHLRSQVFAILQVPVEGTDRIPSEITTGVDNALPIPKDSSQPYAYIAPPGSVADTYEKRIEVTVGEIYRIMRVEYARPTGGAVSGVAHAYEFEQTNRRLGDFAAQVAMGRAWAFDIVAGPLGVGDDDREQMGFIAPTEFDVEDLAADLDNVQRTLGLGLGPTAQRLIRLRTIEKVLPHLNDDDRTQIEEELEEAASREADMQVISDELVKADLEGQDGGDPDADEDDEGEGEGDPPPGGDPAGKKPMKKLGKRVRRNRLKPPARAQ